MLNKKLLKTDIDLQVEQFLTLNLLFFNQDDCRTLFAIILTLQSCI